MALSIFYSASVCLRPQIEVPKWVQTDEKTWVRVDQNEDELTKMSTNWPNSEYELTKSMSTNWPKWERVDLSTNWLGTHASKQFE